VKNSEVAMIFSLTHIFHHSLPGIF